MLTRPGASDRPYVSVNKVLLAQRHTHVFTCVCGCFPATTAELNNYDRVYMTCDVKLFTIRALAEKKIADPCLGPGVMKYRDLY